ncbi:unnamed protein product [Protopolystoma xenopodis]|uniref:Clathrin/coatomer adaptor adaptin-like N-terminal domain-containing protein n=1 Tax=Protopolystoma xenopodis TaxID=117903 RepID=A0A3S5BMH5_9PLAT|nr:unnamed protein product [Protopolystoma xenopodis]
MRQKTLEITIDLVTVRTADELVGLYRKEIIKACSSLSVNCSTSTSSSTAGDVKSDNSQNTSGSPSSTIHSTDETSYLYYLLFTYNDMGDPRAATESCRFLREVIQRYPQHKTLILERLILILPSVTNRVALRQIIWIFGEFCTTLEEINTFMVNLRQILGTLPLVDEEIKRRTIADELASSGSGSFPNGLPTESALFSSDGGSSYTDKSDARKAMNGSCLTLGCRGI